MDTPAVRLRARIESEGPLPFAEFMEEALYGEGGYYATLEPRIGPRGDFVTGSSLSPLFGRTTANLLARLADALGRPADLLEAGYGTGEHLAAVLAAADRGALGRVLGWERIPRPLPQRAVALAEPEELDTPIHGLVFSYELFDALPVHRLQRGAAGWQELHVGVDPSGAFEWRALPLSRDDLPALLGDCEEAVVAAQTVDLSPAWRPLYRRLATCLGRGLMVTADYGFERRRWLDPRVRRHGTLACYRHQRVHRDPFADVGRQDMTAHVDFTALVEEGEAAGLRTVGLLSQAEWLGGCGIFEGLAEADQTTRLAAARLLDPAGMGSDIRILVQARDVEIEGLFALDLGG